MLQTGNGAKFTALINTVLQVCCLMLGPSYGELPSEIQLKIYTHFNIPKPEMLSQRHTESLLYEQH